jgi:hypothetical protein
MPTWASVIKTVFGLVLGAVVTFFWALPAQQQRQDDGIQSLKEKLEVEDKLLRDLQEQHITIMRHQDATDRKIEELTNIVSDHDRRSRGR